MLTTQEDLILMLLLHLYHFDHSTQLNISSNKMYIANLIGMKMPESAWFGL
jgi:hypothetical protein